MLPELDVYPRRTPGVLCEDNFNNGPSGWTQLLNGTNPTGPLILDSEIAYAESRYSLLLSTEDYSDASKPWGFAMAIKRLARPAGVTKIYVDMQWAWGSVAGQNVPRAYEFGIDQADVSGNRRFFIWRWLNYDEAGSARVTKWQLLNNGTYTDIPSAVGDFGYNENKRNLHRLEYVVNVSTGVYDGLRYNGVGFGSLAATPDTTLNAYAPALTTLAPFASGLNVMASIRNRTNTNTTKSWMNIAYCKVVAT